MLVGLVCYACLTPLPKLACILAGLLGREWGLGKCLPLVDGWGWPMSQRLGQQQWPKARTIWLLGVWGSHGTGLWVPGREGSSLGLLTKAIS